MDNCVMYTWAYTLYLKGGVQEVRTHPPPLAYDKNENRGRIQTWARRISRGQVTRPYSNLFGTPKSWLVNTLIEF